MKGIYETRLRIGESGPESSFEQIGEAGCHYRQRLINGAESAINLCKEALGPYFANRRDQEEMLVINLDTKFRPLRIVRVSRGLLDASLVHPREIFRPAIRDAASAIILVHNHPSGDPKPSKEDLTVTRTIEKAGMTVGINVLDHIVVGDGECVSIKSYELNN
jgi:DNA repair protein RadC